MCVEVGGGVSVECSFLIEKVSANQNKPCGNTGLCRPGWQPNNSRSSENTAQEAGEVAEPKSIWIHGSVPGMKSQVH